MTNIPSFRTFEKKLERKYGKPKMIITVSGLAGVGKSSLAKRIAKKYKVTHISSGELFRKEAKRRGMRLSEFLKQMKRIEKEESINFDRFFDEQILEIGYKKKRLVVEGRLSGVLFGKTSKSRIWVHCHTDHVVKRMAKREKETHRKAKQNIDLRNNIDVKRYKGKYKVNFSDKKNYNIFIDNTEPLNESVNEACYKVGLRNSDKAVRSIAISGRIGSGKSTVAKMVAKKLGFRYISGGSIFRPMAKEMGISVTELLRLCKTQKKIHYKLDKKMVSQVKKGKIVADGKLIVWHSDADLKVFLTATQSERSRRVAKRERMSFKAASKDVRRRDRAESDSFTTAYPKLDFKNPPCDLLIDTTKLSIEKTAKKILRYSQ